MTDERMAPQTTGRRGPAVTMLLLLILAGLAVAERPVRPVCGTVAVGAERRVIQIGAAEVREVAARGRSSVATPRSDAAPLVLRFRRVECAGLPAPRAPDA